MLYLLLVTTAILPEFSTKKTIETDDDSPAPKVSSKKRKTFAFEDDDDEVTVLDVLPSGSKTLLTWCSEECTLHQLQSCLESLQSVTQGNDLAFVTTRIELKAVCSKLKDSVLCVDEHMKNCFTATQRKVFNHVVAGARQFLAELCVSGPIQEAYLRHAPCYRNVSLLDDKCALKYKHLVKLSESVDEQKNVDEGLRESCCAFNDFVLCKYIFVTKDCGQDAADFLQQHLDKISSPLLQEHCAHYTYASDACTQSDAVRIFVTSWCLSVTTVLTLVKYIQTITKL